MDINKKITGIPVLIFLFFFAAFFLYPVFFVLQGGFRDAGGNFTLFYFVEVFRNPLYLQGMLNALLIAVCTTSLCLFISLPLARLASGFNFPGKNLLRAGLLMPMVLPPFVGSLGMMKIFGPYGTFNMCLQKIGILEAGQIIDWFGCGSFWGVVLVEALHLYPIMYLNCLAAFANVDPRLHEAAELSGCVGWRRMRKITLPLVIPGIFAGCALVFIWSFTELGTPLMFNYRRALPVQIFEGLQEIDSNGMPYAMVVIMMLLSAGIYIVGHCITGSKVHATVVKAGGASKDKVLKGFAGYAVTAWFLFWIISACLPHLGVLGLSFGDRWYRSIMPSAVSMDHINSALGHNLTVSSIINSLRYAGFAVILAVILGLIVAWYSVRSKSKAGKILDLMAMLPLAVPGLVLAFGYLAMTRKGCFFEFLDPIKNPTVLLVIAYAVRRIPYVVRSVVAGLQQTSVTYEEAGQSSGVSPLRVFYKITLPLISANIIAGVMLAYSFSVLEVSDSLLLAQSSLFFPVTKAMFELSMFLGEGPALAAALGVWTMCFLAATFFAASHFLGKKMGALFRV